MKSHTLLGGLQVIDIQHLLVEKPASVSPGAPMRDVLAKMTEDLRARQVYVVVIRKYYCSSLFGAR
jgi:hypothetical protein